MMGLEGPDHCSAKGPKAINAPHGLIKFGGRRPWESGEGDGASFVDLSTGGMP